jgi:hypothetical protein
MSDRLTWQEKFAAIKALAPASLELRRPDDWYVLQSGVEVARGGMLEGCFGNGMTPEYAVEQHFKKLTKLSIGEAVVTNAMTSERREVRWNGFMWEDAPARVGRGTTGGTDGQ